MNKKTIYNLMEEEKALKKQLEALRKEIKEKQEIDMRTDYFRIKTNEQGKKSKDYYDKFPYQLRFIDSNRKNRYGNAHEYIIGCGTLKRLSDMLIALENGAKELRQNVEQEEEDGEI